MFEQFKLKTLAALTAGALSLALSGSAWAERGVSADRVVIGQSAALSGPARELGLEMRLGAQAYFDFVNRNGGVNGRSIELITLDDGYEPARAKQNTEKLLDQNQVFSLFGYVGTPTSLAAKPLFESARVPFVAPLSGAEALRAPFSSMIFNMRASYYDETEQMIDHLTGFGIKKVAVFYQNDAYGQAGLAGVKRAMDKRGLPISAMGTVERNTVDVAGAARAISAQTPDAVVIVAPYAPAAAFIREYGKSGRPAQFLSLSSVGMRPLAEALGAQSASIVSQVTPPPTERSIPIVAEYQQRLFEKDPKAQPSFTSLEGYMAAKMFVEGLRRAGRDVTIDGFVRSLESMREYDMGGFVVGLSERGHDGSSFVELTMTGKKKDFVH